MPELDIPEWLKPEDLSEGQTTVTFQGEGEYKEIDVNGEKKRVFDIPVKLPDEQEKIWTMNLTSQRAMKEAYGKNTKEWVGKQAVLAKLLQMVSGKEKQVIYGKLAEDKLQKESTEDLV